MEKWKKQVGFGKSSTEGKIKNLGSVEGEGGNRNWIKNKGRKRTLKESQIRPGCRQGEGGIVATPGHGFVSLQQDQIHGRAFQGPPGDSK